MHSFYRKEKVLSKENHTILQVYRVGLTIKGIWLCHIDSDFELNEYGMPKRFSDGLYHIKENPVETTKFFTMNYLRDDISKVLKDRELQIKASGVQTQFKLAILK